MYGLYQLMMKKSTPKIKFKTQTIFSIHINGKSSTHIQRVLATQLGVTQKFLLAVELDGPKYLTLFRIHA